MSTRVVDTEDTKRLLAIIKEKTGMDLTYRDNSFSVKTIPIKKGIKYLSDAGYTDLPSKSYVNKQITGAGATSLAITNNIDYVICVPNTKLILNKLEVHSNIIPLHGSITNEEFLQSLSSCCGSKKIMVTYDSLKRLVSLINPKNYKLMVDECHSLINIGLFRKGAVHSVLSNYDKFNDFVFITATPNTSRFIPVELRDLDFVEFKWGDAVKVDFPVQKVKSKGHHYLVNHCLKYLRGEIEGNLHIFINSVDTIVDMIKRLRKYKEYSDDLMKIVCSDNEYNSAKIAKNLTTLFNETSLRVPKKINWYTSCCWCGSDIMDEDGKILIYVDNKRSITKVCITTQVPQIVGRIRDTKYKDDILMLLVGDIDALEEPNEDIWFQKVLKDFLHSYSRYELYNDYKDNEFGDKVVSDMVSRSSTDPYLIYDQYEEQLHYNVNGILAEMERFSIVHTQYWKLSNSEKPVEDSLYVANVVEDRIILPIDDVDKATLSMKVSYQKMMKNYIKALDYGDTSYINEVDRVLPECKEHIKLLGVKKIIALECSPSKVKEYYDVVKVKYDKFDDIVADTDLKVDENYTVDQVKSIFKVIFNKYNVKERISMSVADYFYETKHSQVRIDGKQVRVIKILGVKDLDG